MPFSDNLYSADDDYENHSDIESFSDELSPTDGYFNRGNMPTNELVPDPSLDTKAPEDKVLIPPGEARQNSERGARATDYSTLSQLYPSNTAASATATDSTPRSPVSNTPSSPISSRRTDDLFSVSSYTPRRPPPPPAYSASPPTSPVVPASFPPPRSYSTFEQHLGQGLPPRHEPQSMGSPGPGPTPIREPTETTPLAGVSYQYERAPPSDFSSKRRSSMCRTFIRKLLLIALVITVLSGLLTTMLNWKSKASDSDSPAFDHPSEPYCPSATIKIPSQIYQFSTDKVLNVVQTEHQGRDPESHVSTSGEVRLRRLPKNSKIGAHFAIDTRVSDEYLEHQIERTWDEGSHHLKVSTPKHGKFNSSGPHCISIEITAWLPEDASFESILIGTVTLGLRVFEDVKINLSGHAQFFSVTGDVSFPKLFNPTGETLVPPRFVIPNYSFNSRRIDIETVSGTITGLYPLYDHLGLKSQSGTITVGVFPQTIDPAAPSPAYLEVITTSSNIEVHLPLINLDKPKFTPPPRDYVTEVKTTSGSISGQYYLGSATSIKSTAGGISMTVMPVILSSGKGLYQNTPMTAFETRTESGTTEIKILDPVILSLLSSKPNQPDRPESPYRPIGDEDPYLLLPPMAGELFQEGKGKTSIAEGDALRTLHSTHKSTSGEISVQYPPVWEGTILAKSVTGNIAVSGNGVKTIREKNNWGSKEVFAKKGVDKEYEGSTAEIRNIAGGLQFIIFDV